MSFWIRFAHPFAVPEMGARVLRLDRLSVLLLCGVLALLHRQCVCQSHASPTDYPFNVGKRCPGDQFDCDPASVSAQCIPLAAVRDCVPDCPNAADEGCGVNQTICDVGIKYGGLRCGKCVHVEDLFSKCIDQKWRNLCHEPNTVRCVGTSNCIHVDWINDGEDDCGDGSDENPCLNGLGDPRCTTTSTAAPQDQEQIYESNPSKLTGYSGHALPCDCADILLSNPHAHSESAFTAFDWRCTDGTACPFKVACEFELLGGGWTLIMRRQKPLLSHFNRTWIEYQHGFGNVSDHGDFWIGNDRLHSMSTSRTCANELLIKLDVAKETRTILARYDHFYVDDQFNSFRLTLGMLEQNPLQPPVLDGMLFARGSIFTTWDRRTAQCGYNGGGWWSPPESCAESALTAPFTAHGSYLGLQWANTRVAAVEMMLRPKLYVPPVRGAINNLFASHR